MPTKRHAPKTSEPKGAGSSRSERLRAASRQRREAQKQELRAAILKAAGGLFLEHGYEHFSLRQVAEQIGYSPGTIYLYFRDKDDLLQAAVGEGFERFEQALRSAARDAADAGERLHRLTDAYVGFGLANPVLYRLMFMQRPDFLIERGEGLLEPKINAFAVLEDAVRTALAEGALPPGEVLSTADVLWSLTHGLVSLAISMPIFDEARVRAGVERLHALVRQIHPAEGRG